MASLSFHLALAVPENSGAYRQLEQAAIVQTVTARQHQLQAIEHETTIAEHLLAALAIICRVEKSTAGQWPSALRDSLRLHVAVNSISVETALLASEDSSGRALHFRPEPCPNAVGKLSYALT